MKVKQVGSNSKAKVKICTSDIPLFIANESAANGVATYNACERISSILNLNFIIQNYK